MAKTLVGTFDDSAAAQNAVRELQAAGVRSNHIRMMSGAEAYSNAEPSTDGKSWADKVTDWFGSLFDDDSDKRYADDYAEAYRRGQVLVIADVDDTMLDRAVGILNEYGTIDLGERTRKWAAGGYTGFDRTAAPFTADERKRDLSQYQQGLQGQAIQGKANHGQAAQAAQQGQVLPVVQEELAIGKRMVQRGGVRIHSYIQERPVEEVVRLREERINVQRRPVNRAATEGDLAFKDRTLDVTAVGEEAVVTKQARVVEEVVVGKQVQERNQTVKDKVRRKDVSVDPIPSSRRGNIAPESQRH